MQATSIERSRHSYAPQTAHNCALAERALRARPAGLQVVVYRVKHGPAEPLPQAGAR